MAVRPLPRPKWEIEGGSPVGHLSPVWRKAALHAARLYGLGYDRKKVSMALVARGYGISSWPKAARITRWRQKLRDWESQPWFRELVWETAVVELDLATPAILKGVAAKAKRGRVDAAKLSLAITGRHVDKSFEQPAAVQINLVGIPRPDARAVQAVEANGEHLLMAGTAEIVEGEYED